MVIAVTYDNATGNVGEHFGHAEHFKLYEFNEYELVDTAVVNPFGQGHAAMVETMLEYHVGLVICQNIGEGAMAGLNQCGIAVVPGVEGAADDAVEAFLNGELQIVSVASCGCGGHEGGCGSHEGGCTCGSSCGGCCH